MTDTSRIGLFSTMGRVAKHLENASPATLALALVIASGLDDALHTLLKEKIAEMHALAEKAGNSISELCLANPDLKSFAAMPSAAFCEVGNPCLVWSLPVEIDDTQPYGEWPEMPSELEAVMSEADEESHDIRSEIEELRERRKRVFSLAKKIARLVDEIGEILTDPTA